MCTVSWIAKDRNYRLYFNRDEQRTRQKAEVPRLKEQDGAKLIAPRDPQGGGSWITANQYGITVFLLNNYSAEAGDRRSRDFRSRGELPLILASQSSAEASLLALRQLDLTGFRPFYLGVIEPLKNCRILSWNGAALDIRPGDIPFLTTSSYRSSEVRDYRRMQYQQMCGKGGYEREFESVFDYHRDQSHPNKGFNPLMSRMDAETHSISVVTVTPSQVSFEYYERLADEISDSPAKVCSIERIYVDS